MRTYSFLFLGSLSKQVDRGSSPWQLDPLQVALTFVNLKVTPEGIQWEPVIPASSLEMMENNGVEAVVKANAGPIERVYLKRLVRQDETGIDDKKVEKTLEHFYTADESQNLGSDRDKN